MSKQNKNKLVDTENKVTVARWEGVGEMSEEVEGIQKYRLAVTK